MYMVKEYVHITWIITKKTWLMTIGVVDRYINLHAHINGAHCSSHNLYATGMRIFWFAVCLWWTQLLKFASYHIAHFLKSNFDLSEVYPAKVYKLKEVEHALENKHNRTGVAELDAYLGKHKMGPTKRQTDPQRCALSCSASECCWGFRPNLLFFNSLVGRLAVFGHFGTFFLW